MDESTPAPGVVGIATAPDATAGSAAMPNALADAVADAGATAVVDDAAAFADVDVDAVVAASEPALYAVVRARLDAPVLPVDTGPSTRGVPRAHAADAIATLVAGDATTTTRRTLAVRTDRADAPDADSDATGSSRSFDSIRALADVMLVTSEPARISEYTLTAAGGVVDRFRADGVVLATPVGSQGYARAAGSAVLAPHTGVLAAVPIAPFATNADDWIVPDDDVSLTVERDEGDVDVRVDDQHVTTVAHTDSVHVAPDDPLVLAVTPESTGPWPHALEKH